MTKFIKLKNKNKKERNILTDAASKGELTAYIKHDPTGALVPVSKDAIKRMENGEMLDFHEAERLYDRFYFKVPFLAIRWGIITTECLGKLIEFKIPSFFNPNEVEIKGNKASVGADNVCVFKEYVDALEKKIMKIKKNVEPEYIGN